MLQQPPASLEQRLLESLRQSPEGIEVTGGPGRDKRAKTEFDVRGYPSQICETLKELVSRGVITMTTLPEKAPVSYGHGEPRLYPVYRYKLTV